MLKLKLDFSQVHRTFLVRRLFHRLDAKTTPPFLSIGCQFHFLPNSNKFELFDSRLALSITSVVPRPRNFSRIPSRIETSPVFSQDVGRRNARRNDVPQRRDRYDDLPKRVCILTDDKCGGLAESRYAIPDTTTHTHTLTYTHIHTCELLVFHVAGGNEFGRIGASY